MFRAVEAVPDDRSCDMVARPLAEFRSCPQHGQESGDHIISMLRNRRRRLSSVLVKSLAELNIVLIL